MTQDLSAEARAATVAALRKWADAIQANRPLPPAAYKDIRWAATFIERTASEPADKGESSPSGTLADARTALEWVRSELVALCEHTEDRCAPMAGREYETKFGAFARGRVHEAKGIRRAMCEVIRCRIADLASASEPRSEAERIPKSEPADGSSLRVTADMVAKASSAELEFGDRTYSLGYMLSSALEQHTGLYGPITSGIQADRLLRKALEAALSATPKSEDTP